MLLDCENRPGGANDVAWGDGVLLAVFADTHSSPASPCPFSISVSSSSSSWMREREITLTFKVLRYWAVLKYDRFHVVQCGA